MCENPHGRGNVGIKQYVWPKEAYVHWYIVDQFADEDEPVIVKTFTSEQEARAWAAKENEELDAERYLARAAGMIFSPPEPRYISGCPYCRRSFQTCLSLPPLYCGSCGHPVVAPLLNSSTIRVRASDS